jgi:hypothetical protein
VLLGLTPRVAWAQAALPPAAITTDEAAALTSGWALLAEGRAGEAAQLAARLQSASPRNTAVLALAVEAEIALRGATASLNWYEQWLGGRALDEAGALRRVARAFLYEWARQTTDGASRAAALKALAEDGDGVAFQVLNELAGQGGRFDLAAMAALGNRDAVQRLVANLNAAPGLRTREIEALGASGSPDAVAPLIAVLRDPDEVNRAAAASALGRLGQREAIEPLKLALNDARGAVRLEAAGALYAMQDFSGYQQLVDLTASDNPHIRMSGAALLASQPNDAWRVEVERLLGESDPYVRLQAARLLAPHDPERAETVVRELMRHPDRAIPEAAAPILAEIVPDTLAALRPLLRRPEGAVAVKAASRLLGLTR